ncbi:MAG TPA: DUF4252 domain-containing protein [Steroidobacteraceae bacterium]|jgi:hypothetical protein|nr:DUF4252 domain-containing protein [Steroidobacteraceae bacterium]
MKIHVVELALACFLLPAWGSAQDAKLKLPDFSSLASKATESVNVSLNPWLLRIAAASMDDKDADSAATKKLLSAIKSIEIRNFQFSTDFAYSAADIDAVRRQLRAPGWSQLMQVHDRNKGADVDIYIRVENDRTSGFALIASEPREFTIINIVGSISVEDLPRLENHLHLPKTPVGQVHLVM